jgi:hypothetical protein
VASVGLVINRVARPSALSGLWVLVVGGAAIVLLLLFLDPIVSTTNCLNHGGNGHAGACAEPDWDFLLMLLLPGWILLVVVEQVLPVTWRHRSRLAASTRALTAVVLALIGSCFLLVEVVALGH